MSNIEHIVDALEGKINKILQKMALLKQVNVKLTEELKVSEQAFQNQKAENAKLKEDYELLKMANSMLGSNDNKKETKLKINSLIREIDHCIAQLSD